MTIFSISLSSAEIIEQRTDIIFMINLGRRQLVYLVGRSITVNNGNNSASTHYDNLTLNLFPIQLDLTSTQTYIQYE